MNKDDSRGHLYSSGARKAIRVSATVGIFALAYAVVAFAIGFIPINLMLRRMMGSAIMLSIWVNSAVQLAERTAVAALACWLALLVSGRGRGRLTGRGMLAVGAAMSGALAGALDAGAHKLLVSHLIRAARIAQWRGHLLSDTMTFVVSVAITLLFITRSTSVLKVE
ncbi:MAG: hypothetical protein ABI311_01645 [Gemmatimonadaceae bacterium]